MTEKLGIREAERNGKGELPLPPDSSTAALAIQERDQKIASMEAELAALAQKVKKLKGHNSSSMELIHDFEKQN